LSKIINYLQDTGLSDETLDFLERSKMNEYDAIEYSKRLNIIMGTDYFMQHIINTTQELSSFEMVSLPEFKSDSDAANNLSQLNFKRKSVREYSEDNIDFNEFSNLLKLSYTITKKMDGYPPSRNIASGGGLYPIDLYVVNRKVTGLKLGVHFYNVHNSSLDLVFESETLNQLDDQINKAFFSDQKVDMDYKNAAAYIVLGGVLNRVCFKYLDRGLRFALVDTGAIIHSLYLASTALKIGSCGVGSYADDLVSELIGYKTNIQTVLGVVLIGKI
jgi:SagB-type dehydrogenase family enzyme